MRGPVYRVALVVLGLAAVCRATPALAKDLGDILVEKGLITADELRQAREEEKQKSAAEESRREAISAKLPKWLDMFTPFGDLRLRTEGFYANDLNARTRFRLRARIGMNVNPSDEIGATVRIASGNPDDPISTNQSFERTFTRKSINLDQAYLTVKPGKTFGLEPGWGSFIGGKMGMNLYRVSELVFDDDLSPEGAMETVNLVETREDVLRSLKINAVQWVVDEVASAGDPWMIGGQVVADVAVPVHNGPRVTVAFADYNWQSLDKVARKFLEKSSSSFNSQLANSNAFTHDADGKITGFASNFNIVNGGGEVNFGNVIGTYSAGLFGEVAYNTQAADSGVGFATGVGFGNSGKDWYHNSLKNPGEWAISYTYERVGKDAVLALFSMSDLDYVTSSATQKGSSNMQASILKLDYVLLPNFQLTAKASFINALDKSESNANLNGNATLLRTQLDAVLKF